MPLYRDYWADSKLQQVVQSELVVDTHVPYEVVVEYALHMMKQSTRYTTNPGHSWSVQYSILLQGMSPGHRTSLFTS
jgi:hypothetical protein